ncbi:MAG: DUF799 family lipoprotein [Deltaproteobacteria bacterium]|nr:DUF799 family lipoprotein [Deltaproteobacteria bacterium]
MLPPLFLLALFALSCTQFPSQTQPEALSPALRGGGPVRVAVLPFQNETTEPDLETLMRMSFYNHFSSKSYRDIELSQVDRALQVWENDTSKSWKTLSPAELGKLLETDVVIYGKVQEYKKLFLGIYSQIALKAQVEMVDCTSGEGLWWKTLMKRSHDGGVPFDLFGVVPAALRSGFHMKKERTLDLIDRINRELMEAIPSPPESALTPTAIDLQVASFLDETLAQGAMSELTQKGLSPRIETVMVKDRLWHRILVGPFPNSEEAEKVRKGLEEGTTYRPIFLYRMAEQAGKGVSEERPEGAPSSDHESTK